jgi:hypothetical protein
MYHHSVFCQGANHDGASDMNLRRVAHRLRELCMAAPHDSEPLDEGSESAAWGHWGVGGEQGQGC